MRKPLLGILVLVPLVTSCAVMAPVRGNVVPGAGGDGRMEDAIVFIESRGPIPRRPTPRNPVADSIVVVDGHFEPRLSATVMGSRLTIQNEDKVFHSPFSRSPAAPFRGQPLRTGQTLSVHVRSSGMLRIFCELHKREYADVLVLRHGMWARPDERGHFALPELPRGRYTLHAWHPTLGVRSVPLTIRRRGPVTLELHY